MTKITAHTFKFALKYLMVGALSALVYFLVFALSFYLMAGHEVMAVTLGYFMAVCVHFIGNRRYAFQHHAGAQLAPVIMKYAVMLAFNYGISLLVMDVAVVRLGCSPYVGVILSIGSTIFTGYILAYYWVFVNKRKNTCAV